MKVTKGKKQLRIKAKGKEKPHLFVELMRNDFGFKQKTDLGVEQKILSSLFEKTNSLNVCFLSSSKLSIKGLALIAWKCHIKGQCEKSVCTRL